MKTMIEFIEDIEKSNIPTLGKYEQIIAYKNLLVGGHTTENMFADEQLKKKKDIK
jgi:hypothetical protein